LRFNGKCSIVTGGASGIGRSVCFAFAQEGATLGIVDVNLSGAETTAQEVAKYGMKTVSLKVDVTDPGEVRTMVEQIEKELGQIDILVNCAGVREIAPFLEISFQDWKRVIDVNLNGTFLCSQSVARHMIRRNIHGSMVNIASVAGLMGVPNRPAYCASKHAVIGLTKEMALELAPNRIRVNAVAPSTIETSLAADRFSDPQFLERLKKAFPLGRWGMPEEVANLILFLASDQSEFITGAVYLIDGGYMAGRGI
jgi:NAD(P)-dependent dehydrogenase (short-subunit alcohol dehydrogenase family)